MNTRSFGNKPLDAKGFQLTITYKGRTYAICDSKQYDELVYSVVQELASGVLTDDLLKDGRLEPDRLREIAEKTVQERGFSTLDKVLAMMTPEERKQWKTSYRFTPLSTRNIQ